MAANGDTKKIGAEVALLGAPMDDGAEIAGAALGPRALRKAGLARMIEKLGYRVADHGDVAPSSQPGNDVDIKGSARNAARVAASARTLCDAAYNLMCGDVLPIFLDGDHSILMGPVNGVARHFAEHGCKLFVLRLYAHADFITPMTTHTGNMHGMPLVFLCGEPLLDCILGNEPRVLIDPRRVWLFGTRAVDPGEGEWLRARGVGSLDIVELNPTLDQHGVSANLIIDLFAALFGMSRRVGEQCRETVE